MDIKTLSITELKALGYEQITLLNQTQNNLRLIEQEINSRTPTQPTEGE
jgi:hypothetical protein